MIKFNATVFKTLMIIALAPAALAIIVGNPPLGILVALICLSILVPSFQPFRWFGRAISNLFSGLSSMINTILSGTFSVIAATITGFFGLLTFGWLPGRRGAKFLGGWEHWKLLSRHNNGLLIDGHRYHLSQKASFESVLTVGGTHIAKQPACFRCEGGIRHDIRVQ